MEDHRDKLPAPETAPAPNDAPGLPEEADEIIEIVDDDAPRPAAAEGPVPPVQPVRPVQEEYPERAREELRRLRAQLDRKDKQIEQVMEAYRGKKAETEKLRERIEKTERRRFEQSKGDFIARFVEVLDNLDRAIDSIEGAFDPDAVLQGIMLVRSRLVQLLKEEGLEKIFVRGQTFDPTHSEAAQMEPVGDESQDGVVVKELMPGYMLKGSLLRAARVVVARYDGPREAPAAEDLEDPPSEQPTAERPPAAERPHRPNGDESWETNESGHELEFSEDGFDFTSD